MNTKPQHHIALDIFVFITVIFIAYMLQDIIVPLLFSIILSVLLYPIVNTLEKRFRFNRILSAIVSILLLFTVIISIITFIGVQFDGFSSKSKIYISKIENKIVPFIKKAEKTTGIKTDIILEAENIKVEKVVKDNFSKISQFLYAFGSVIGSMIVIPLYMFFFLLYRKFFLSFIYSLCEKRCSKADAKEILIKLFNVQQNYLVGLLTVMFIVGVLNSIGLLLLGIDYPFFLVFYVQYFY